MKNHKQSGMASIMFAIFMAIVLCLLAVGFATLVRNDQRQTEDKTLSNQAAYAAESAINYIQKQYVANQGYADGTAGKCETAPPNDANVDPYLNAINTQSSGITITCLSWTSVLQALNYNNVSTKPVVVPIVPESGSVRSITISWSPAVSSNSGKYNGASTSRLTFSPVNIPTLKIAAASSPAVGDTKVAYISPLGSGGGSYNLSATESGGIAGASCSGSLCTVTLIGLPGGTWSNGVLSITSLNGDSSNITITANGGAGTTNLIKAQAKIDATAKSQDVIKRIVVYIPLSPTIWQPDFAVSAEYLCKNYRVDANGNASASTFYTPPMVSNTVCP